MQGREEKKEDLDFNNANILIHKFYVEIAICDINLIGRIIYDMHTDYDT